MLIVVVLSILAAACAFMLTVLYHFYRDLTGPSRRAPAAPYRRVVTINRSVVLAMPEATGQDSPEHRTGAQGNPPAVFPAGVRRLAAKRAARS
ncbi:MAG TPA: hypothetical protein VMB47_18020 [Candidatus Aquilonibacter sp.]|nr:hypothetical protein [Candidatus Aquilonibacter sp.]